MSCYDSPERMIPGPALARPPRLLEVPAYYLAVLKTTNKPAVARARRFLAFARYSRRVMYRSQFVTAEKVNLNGLGRQVSR